MLAYLKNATAAGQGFFIVYFGPVAQLAILATLLAVVANNQLSVGSRLGFLEEIRDWRNEKGAGRSNRD